MIWNIIETEILKYEKLFQSRIAFWIMLDPIQCKNQQKAQ